FRGPGPQHPVDTALRVRVGRVDQHLLSLRERLAGEAANHLQALGGVEIKIDAGHLLSAWRRAKRTRSGTGRPVEPFSRPPFHAVPAMSRCAQRSFLVKRARKDAAVMLPAGRPPILAMSAKLERSCSW